MSSELRGEYLAVRDGADLIHSSEVVQAAVQRTARAIETDLGDRDPLVLCVMVGGFRFTSDLVGHLDCPLEVDYLQVSRYRDGLRGGHMDWLRYPSTSLRGREVLVVDDVLDEGVTLAAVLEHCREVGAATVASAVLIDKNMPGKKLDADYVALEAPDRFLFGEGMDYKGYGRNLRGVWALGENA